MDQKRKIDRIHFPGLETCILQLRRQRMSDGIADHAVHRGLAADPVYSVKRFFSDIERHLAGRGCRFNRGVGERRYLHATPDIAEAGQHLPWVWRRCFVRRCARRSSLRPSASELEFAAILIASGRCSPRAWRQHWPICGIGCGKSARMQSGDPHLEEPRASSGGHLDAAFNLKVVPAAASPNAPRQERATGLQSLPRKRPPASRRRQVAIKVARGAFVASRRRKA